MTSRPNAANSLADRQRLGEQLRTARTRLGMTQQDLADIAGIWQCRITPIETASTDIMLSGLVDTAAAVGRRVALVAEHHLPLLDLTAAEVAAIHVHSTSPADDAGDAAPAAGYRPLPAREERDATTFLRQLGWTPPAEVEQLRAERDRYREHSVTLNSIAWRIASALGDVPDGADQIPSDPVGRTDRLIAEVGQLRAEQDAAHALGWRDAVAALVDDETYMDWWESSGAYPDEPARSHLARYLDAVGPNGAPEIPSYERYTITTCFGTEPTRLECDHCDGLVESVEAGDSLEDIVTRARDHERVCSTARPLATGAKVDG